MFLHRFKFVHFVFLALTVCLVSPQARAEADKGREGQVLSIGETFAGEELKYGIGFWFFKDVAESRVSLKANGQGKYTATLTARTTGVIDTILKHRRDRYVAKLKVSEDGKRFITESFEKEMEMDGKGTRKSVYTVDYKARTVNWKSWGGGSDEKTGSAAIPEGKYADDPIAAFYNFRFGVYGEIGEGRDYSISTFPKEKSNPVIRIRTADQKEFRKRTRDESADILADARIDKELFGSKDGDIEILFKKDMVPVQAVAKGLIFFGDIKGRLKEVVAPASSARKISME